MATEEIERRYLVPESELVPAGPEHDVMQGYLLDGARPGMGNVIVHAVELDDGTAVLRVTPKVETSRAAEVEVQIPPKDAQAIEALLPNMWLRVRVTGGTTACLTLKGRGVAAAGGDGPLRRPEFEYDISLAEAYELLELYCGFGILVKVRREVMFAGRTFEVDYFTGVHSGLVIAEVELDAEDVRVEKPAWVGREISQEHGYSNAELAVSAVRPPVS